MSTVFSIEINFQLRYICSVYFHHLGIQNFGTVSNTVQKGRKVCPPKSLFTMYTGHKKSCTYVWLYFIYLSPKTSKLPGTIINIFKHSDIIMQACFENPTTGSDIFKNNNIVMSIQFFHNRFTKGFLAFQLQCAHRK